MLRGESRLLLAGPVGAAQPESGQRALQPPADELLDELDELLNEEVCEVGLLVIEPLVI